MRAGCRQTVVCRRAGAVPQTPQSASRTRVEKLRRTDRPITYFRHVLFGYARVSTADQNPDHQIDALQRAGVARDDIYVDHASGAKASRPELDNVLRLLRDGDTLKITRLDRLGRSVLHLVTLGAELRERGVGLHVVEQGIDTSTAEGRAMFGMLSVLAELQRELIVANTRDGLAAARARGRKGGRRPKLDAEQLAFAQQLYDAGDRTVQQIADLFGVPRTTVYGTSTPPAKASGPPVGPCATRVAPPLPAPRRDDAGFVRSRCPGRQEPGGSQSDARARRELVRRTQGRPRRREQLRVTGMRRGATGAVERIRLSSFPRSKSHKHGLFYGLTTWYGCRMPAVDRSKRSTQLSQMEAVLIDIVRLAARDDAPGITRRVRRWVESPAARRQGLSDELRGEILAALESASERSHSLAAVRLPNAWTPLQPCSLSALPGQGRRRRPFSLSPFARRSIALSPSISAGMSSYVTGSPRRGPCCFQGHLGSARQ